MPEEQDFAPQESRLLDGMSHYEHVKLCSAFSSR